MDNLDALHAALIKADAAGDTTSAKALSDHIRTVSAGAPAAQNTSLLDSAWDGTKNLGLGLLKGVLAPIDGGAQLLTKGLSSATHAIAPGSAADSFMQGQANDVSNINTDRENKYQALTPGSVAAGVGNVIGNVAVPVPGVSILKGASMASKLAVALKTGTAIGASQPVYGAGDKPLDSTAPGTETGNYWGEKAKQIGIGAALGGALSGLGSVAGTAYKAVQPVISPSSTVGNMLAAGLDRASTKSQAEAATGATQGADAGLGDISGLTGSHTAADVLARLRGTGSLVPGSLPTTAQVAGVPQLVMAEKVLKNNPAYRGAFEDRAIANNLARTTALQGIAKTPQDLAAALDARASQTGPMYDTARSATHDVDDQLTQLLARPSASQAIARGRALAQERGETMTLDSAADAAPATEKFSSILDSSGKPFSSAVPGAAETPGTIGGNTLQYLKMGLDDLQTAGRTQGMGSHEAGALRDTQDALHSWMEKNSPEFAKANSTYSALSRPVNTMEAGQSLYDGLANGVKNAAGDVSPMLSQYRTQLAKALKNSKYGIDPDAQKTLEAIQSDLQRETISNSIKSSGSDTAFNAQAPNWLSGQLFGGDLDGKSLLGRGAAALGGFMTGGTMGAAGGALGAQKLGQFVGNRVNGEFQKAMLDPAHFAKLLGEALDRQSGKPSTLNKLTPSGARAATVGTENILSPGP